jgi:long-chain acyl-CoA synthetase
MVHAAHKRPSSGGKKSKTSPRKSAKKVSANHPDKAPEGGSKAPKKIQASHDSGTPPALVDFMMKDWAVSRADDAPMPHADAFRARRKALSALFPGETLLIPTGHEKLRANDTYHRFRPGTDFFYLTGSTEPDGVLALIPTRKGHQDVLFVEPNPGRSDPTFFTDRKKGELWVGPRLGVPESQRRFGVDEARPLPELPRLLEKLAGKKKVRRLRGVDEILDRAIKTDKKQDAAFAQALSEMRLLKEPLEVAELESSIASTRRGFEDVIRRLRRARSEREVEGVFNLRARVEGNDVGYGTIAACGSHACVLHWTHNNGEVKQGDLLLLDAGVEGNSLYTADITRCLPVSGTFSPEQREIYDLVLESQEAAMAQVKPGNDFLAPNRAAMDVLARGLERMGLLASADEALKEENLFYKRYTLHNVSHMLGLDVHDCAQARQEAYKFGKLRPGMVLTIEPGLYFQLDDETVPQKYRGIGVRIEDDVLVTEDGVRNLSADIPKTAREVEAWMASVWARKEEGLAMPADTIPQRLIGQARLRPDAMAYFTRDHGGWRGTSWKAHFDEVKQAARALIALGFQPGQTVCILGYNRPEWTTMALACMGAGGAPAGIYTTCSHQEVQYIVEHAEAPVILVENQEQWEKIKAERANLPRLKQVVVMKGAPAIDDPLVLSWEAFLARAGGATDEAFFERIEALRPENLATLIYTSGTTGPPKGVMLSHRNLAWTSLIARDLVDARPSDRMLSYLPLSHIAEQMFSIHGAVTSGYAVYYAESLPKLADNLKEVEPTVFFGVPRVWEKFYAGVSQKLSEARGAKAKLLSWARSVGSSVTTLRGSGSHPSGALALQYTAAQRFIFRKLRGAIGLGKARVCVSGAAPIAPEVLSFFGSLDIPILEVYGQSEDTGPTSFNRPNRMRLGTVGPVVPGVEVKIAGDGEILVRGPNVFLGYFKDPEATAEALIDGWLHSGDLGEIDRDGFLSITGRKKEIIITAGGKNISPKNIENAIKGHELVGEAVVIGDRRKFLTALITLEPEAAARFAAQRGLKVEALPDHPEVNAQLQRAIDEINTTLARVETVKKFKILPRAFAMEQGELTPTLKVKRKNVHKNFAAEIEAMYAE